MGNTVLLGSGTKVLESECRGLYSIFVKHHGVRIFVRGNKHGEYWIRRGMLIKAYDLLTQSRLLNHWMDDSWEEHPSTGARAPAEFSVAITREKKWWEGIRFSYPDIEEFRLITLP